jgi:hypothetical protein
MKNPAWLVGLVVGAVAVPASCVGGIVAVEWANGGSIDGELVLDGVHATFAPERCRNGLHLDFTGLTIVAGEWALDIVDEQHGITAYLRGPGLPHELALDAEHCSKHELTLHDDSDEDTDRMSGTADLVCAYDMVRVRGHLDVRNCH